MSRRFLYFLGILAIVSGGLILMAQLLLATGTTYATNMGSMGGMDNMPMGPMPTKMPPPGRPIRYSAAHKLVKYSNREGMLMGHGQHQSVMFMGHNIHIVMVAVEPGSPDQTFEIHKLVDPKITLPAGAKVTVTLLNMDFGPGMVHGLVIGKAAPPYATIVPAPVKDQLAEIPLLMPRTLKDVTQAQYFAGSTTFTAPADTGTYYYLCQMPGHAKQGMYGQFVVTPSE